MRKIREILRLKAEAGLSDQRIAEAIGSARSTVQECLRRCREAGIGWPLPEDLDEEGLQARLYRRTVPTPRSPLPDFARIQAELKRPGVTRALLWAEYKAADPEGLQLQPVLRSVPPLARHPGSCVASASHPGRQVLRRLRRTDGGSHRPVHRGSAASADLRRGPWGELLHLRRGDLDPEPSRLAWESRART